MNKRELILQEIENLKTIITSEMQEFNSHVCDVYNDDNNDKLTAKAIIKNDKREYARLRRLNEAKLDRRIKKLEKLN